MWCMDHHGLSYSTADVLAVSHFGYLRCLTMLTKPMGHDAVETFREELWLIEALPPMQSQDVQMQYVQKQDMQTQV